MKEEEKFDFEKINEMSKQLADMIGYKTFICDRCEHKDVCKFLEEKREKCELFLPDNDYKNIEQLFDPIFEWIEKHYPLGDVYFIVEPFVAKMMMKHGDEIHCKRIRQCVDSAKLGIAFKSQDK